MATRPGAVSASQRAPESTDESSTREGDHHPEIDWQAAEESPEFKELIARRRRFVLPATIFFFAWYFGFILLAGYAPGFMGESIYQGFTVGYLLALTQFVMVWVLAAMYVRKAEKDFDPLAATAAQTAIDAGRARHDARPAGGAA